ncbi:hypothetical protein A3860_09700 [Niastella vici]|uniref:Uncharacterized protein n=2 Tax=Niastella vici TaxID=1703345 RepID=A0A1V9FER1_9BACT|nr:hypothetical protein A3860_09700 [Niastella vici]
MFNFMRMKKVYKIKSELFNQVSTYTVDENLNKLKGKVLAPKKLEEANKLLRKLKTPLPK